MRALHPCALTLLRTSCAGWDISILQKACLFVAGMDSNMVGTLFQEIKSITHAGIFQIQTTLQFRSSELPLRLQCDMDYIITIIQVKTKCKTCILLLLSLTNAVCLSMFLK